VPDSLSFNRRTSPFKLFKLSRPRIGLWRLNPYAVPLSAIALLIG